MEERLQANYQLEDHGVIKFESFKLDANEGLLETLSLWTTI